MRAFRAFFGLWVGLLMAITAGAQTVVSGRVTDAVTGEALPDVIVKALRSDSARAILSYAVADAEGRYRLTVAGAPGTFDVEFSVLGYATAHRRMAASSGTVDAALQPSAFSLKEVTVKAPPISSHGDTLNYNVASFITKADRNVEDILRKLPGITVKPGGGIEYQGKPINKFYIEGLDMLSGRYTLATRNIRADQITNVQVYENHQPVRLLKGIDFSEQAALNIKLKDNRMARPVGNALAGIGYRPDLLYRAELFGFMADAKSQVLATVKADNLSPNTGDELADHFVSEEGSRVAGLIPSLPFAVPSEVSERTRRSSGAGVSANTIRRTGEHTTLKLNLGYTHRLQRYEREAITTYSAATDSAISAYETLRADDTDHQLTASAVYEKNAESTYVSESFDVRLGFGHVDTRLQLPAVLRQHVANRQAILENRLSMMWRSGKDVFRLQSRIRGNLIPGNRLTVDNHDGDRTVVQRIEGLSLQTNHSTAFAKGLNAYNNLHFDVSLDTEHDRIDTKLDNRIVPLSARNLNSGYRLQPAVTTTYVFERNRLRLTLDVPVSYLHIRYRDRQTGLTFRHDRPYATARLSGRYQLTPALILTASGGFTHSTGDMLSFLRHPVQHTYNYIFSGESGRLEQRQGTNLTAGYHYRNTMAGLFSTLTMVAGRTRRNTMRGEIIDHKGAVTARTAGTTSHTRLLSGSFYLAKNAHDLNTTFALTAGYSYYDGERLRQMVRLKYANRQLSIHPSVSIRTIAWMVVQLRGSFERFSQTTGAGTTVSHSAMQQWGTDADLTLLPLPNVEVYAQADYRDQPTEKGLRRHRWLVDAGIRYQPAAVIELELKLQNLTNTDRYTDIYYRDADRFTSTFFLRPTSAIASLKYSF